MQAMVYTRVKVSLLLSCNVQTGDEGCTGASSGDVSEYEETDHI